MHTGEVMEMNKLNLSILTFTMVLLCSQAVPVLSDIVLLMTNKRFYYKGQVVVIRGRASLNEYVAIQVKSPSGRTVWIDIVVATPGGTFICLFRLWEDAEYGEYIVYATPPMTTIDFWVIARR